LTYVDQEELKVVVNIQGENAESDYNSKHLRYIMGISKEDIPCVWIFSFKSDK